MRLAAVLFVTVSTCLVGQDFSDLKVERVASGYQFLEGPVWSKAGYLLFSDVPTNRILQVGPQGVTVFRENSGGANGNAFDSKGNLYTCEGNARRLTRTDPKGKVEVLADKWEGKPLNAPNDVVVRQDGNVYFTDPAFGSQGDKKELPFFGVFHVTPKGELSLVARMSTRPNGVALAPNGHILYVANSDERTVRAYDLDRSGATSNERVLITGIDGVPDGLRVDEKGNLYVTCRGVAIYTPAGKFIRMIEIPETPANCAFGEGDWLTLFVTARTSLYRIRVPVKGSVQY
jgi:gluconolactonase